MHALEALTQQHSHIDRCRSVLITHVLNTAEEYIRSLNEIFPVVLIVAIPYSANALVIDRLQESGFSVYCPETIHELDTFVGSKIQELLEADSTPLMVQEVGGYLAQYTQVLAQFPHFLGIVEDTNQGHWRYQAIDYHPVPILSIAQSPIKAIEDSIIGDAAIYSLERMLREDFGRVIQGSQSGVIGYGKIGSSTAIALRGRESAVMVYDKDPVKSVLARFHGYRMASLNHLLSQSELIIGCTGKTSIGREEIPYIRDGAILVSASSKSKEFDLLAFAQDCRKEDLCTDIWRYHRSDGSYFYLLNRGTPINFRDQSILGNLLDLIYCELFLCMCLLAKKESPRGFHNSPAQIHTQVVQEWLAIYEPSFLELRLQI